VSRAENGAERAKESDEWSRAVSGSRKKKRAERSAKREVVERERSGERPVIPTLPCNCKTFTITIQKSSEIMLTFA